MAGVTAPTRLSPPDPSAALLDRIAQEALSPAYHQRAHGHGDGRRPGGRFALATIALLAIAGLLVGVLVAASRQRAADVDSERGSLVSLAESAQDEVSGLEQQAAELDVEVTALREQALGTESVGREQAQQISTLGIVAGTQPVAGPGARVVVADGEPEVGAGDSSSSQVLDIDLQQVVNGLWEAGAEAVSINGQRVGALTAIRSVDVILVNFNPVVSPYEVEAIGDPRRLPTDFLRSSGGQWLQAINLSAGIPFSIDSVNDDLSMAGEPAGPLRYASPVVPAPSAETS